MCTIIEFPLARRYGYQVQPQDRAAFLRIIRAKCLANESQTHEPDYSVDNRPNINLVEALRAVQNIFTLK